MREGRLESAANQRGAGEEEAGARAARVRPRPGRPRSSQARAGVGLLNRTCTSDLGCRQGRRDARAKPLPPGAAPDTGQYSAFARRCGPGFPAFGSAESASTLPQPGPDTRPCRPAPHLVGTRGRRREAQSRTVACTLHSYRRSTPHIQTPAKWRGREPAAGAHAYERPSKRRGQGRSAPPRFQSPITAPL